jgi:molybdenum-dependent DNA-binding transcriptional regulator ModE
MSTMNMSRWAQRYGIQRRPRGEASKAANLAAVRQGEQAPAILRPALSQIGGAARLSRFETVFRYPTITAAAADLGLRQAVLTSQITRLEGELGGALVERAQRGRPMTITTRGARVLRAWEACHPTRSPIDRQCTPPHIGPMVLPRRGRRKDSGAGGFHQDPHC